MKSLVVFYSRTGTTKKIGEELAQLLACDSEELVDTIKRSGPVGYASAVRDAMQKKLTTLADIKQDPALYDLVILGTPIWGGTLSSAMRTYISANKSTFKKVAFFCTNGVGHQKLFDEMEALCGRRPIHTLGLPEKEVKHGDYQDKLRQFAYRFD
ncbi:MAG: flavodoxin domain-containing protein [Euryarchaeota archaeon]|nr:flavodoxin domain-containing protein [Euryarchaeota archaeon]